MDRVRKTLRLLFFACLLGLLGGANGWAFSRSLLDESDQTDPAWLLAEAPAATSAAAVPAQTIIEKKSHLYPGVAVTLALAPGIALHGAGHLYAGRPWTGGALLLAEVGGLYMAYRGGSDVYSAVNSVDYDKFSNFHGDTGQLSNGLGLAIGGAMIFLSSWLYDITGSPIAAEQTNAEVKPGPASSAPVVTPRLTMRGVELAFERLF